MLRKNGDKIKLYIISLWLLFILVLIVTIDVPMCFGGGCSYIGTAKLLSHNIIPIFSIILILLGFFFLLQFKYKISGTKLGGLRVEKIENRNYEHLTFLSTYIIPLIAFDLTKIKYVIVLFLLLFAIGCMYVKTNLFYTNPTLALLGYKIFKANVIFKDGSNDEIILISTQTIEPGNVLSYLPITKDIFYVRMLSNE